MYDMLHISGFCSEVKKGMGVWLINNVLLHGLTYAYIFAYY